MIYLAPAVARTVTYMFNRKTHTYHPLHMIRLLNIYEYGCRRQ